ncbi:cytochrome P450 [Phytohabitans sp. ZYX-F-186]|uniref:Cytochrome P450 n=1 Tax=Phytohabitans maris TaxID=3071409 RepID=A0ABU0ZRG7_9ACTN|nr:cytochrome P450 [Phytohabitans sp. ZYX-F-186]MDQ7909351.1 cytochrome P450 [Phytohabitans sp. ZYX-F-186]
MAAGPDTVVTDFDHHSEAFAQRPFEVLTELRERAPVAWSTAHDGFWVVTGHQECVDGFADYATFSSSAGPAIPVNPFGPRHIPVALDPPEHGMYRRVLNEWYSKAAIARREPEIRALVEGIVRDLAARGSWDFVPDLANVSPGAVTLGILGWDPGRRRELLDVMSRALRGQGSKDPEVVARNAEGNRWIREQILAEARDRRTDPRDDLMTVLATEPIAGGRTLTDEEICDTVVLLLLAGFHTTSGALTSLLVHLERHPDMRRGLERDHDLIPDAIEEIVRIYSPATAHARIVTRDVELGGVWMREGDWTLFVNMAANHDPAAFDDPDEVRLGRDRAKSVAFGWGVHRCLGLHLARLILRLEVEAVLDLLPGYRIDLDRVVRSDHMGIGYVYLSVPAHLPQEA